MRRYLCVGNYSSIPYLIQGLELRVYSMEELAYGLKENAFLLDNSLMSDTLINWIREQCGLDELADFLHPMVHRQGSMSTFVTTILQYVGLYDADTIREVDQVLKKGAGLTGMEKRKEQVDYLAKKKKYLAAIRGYDSLLIKWEELGKLGRDLPAADLKADIHHNKGVVYARLMLYHQAGECFLDAYRITGDPQEYLCFLGTKRLELPEKEYISFAAGEMEHYEQTLELEKKMEEIRREFALQPERLMLDQRAEHRNGHDIQLYCEDNEQLCRALKNNYRQSVGE